MKTLIKSSKILEKLKEVIKIDDNVIKLVLTLEVDNFAIIEITKPCEKLEDVDKWLIPHTDTRFVFKRYNKWII